jgi:hypothetical protein
MNENHLFYHGNEYPQDNMGNWQTVCKQKIYPKQTVSKGKKKKKTGSSAEA